jgi:hypothetical protein
LDITLNDARTEVSEGTVAEVEVDSFIITADAECRTTDIISKGKNSCLLIRADDA